MDEGNSGEISSAFIHTGGHRTERRAEKLPFFIAENRGCGRCRNDGNGNGEPGVGNGVLNLRSPISGPDAYSSQRQQWDAHTVTCLLQM